jgi:cell division protein FtsZ
MAQPEHRAQPRPLPARPAASSGSLDSHGRPTHRAPVTEDDHLDIPAFLRRQQS